jgi:hypothetical protein
MLTALGESTTVIVIYHGLIFMLAVIVITGIATAVICWTIETMEGAARRFRGWLREPKKIGRTIWA